MATLRDITSTVWGISTVGYGYVAEGIADLRQCIEIIIKTTKGTDPLRPEFGSDVYKFIDKPVTIAIPNIKKAIFESVGIWEKRVEIVKITHRLLESHIWFDITYRIIDSGLIDNLLLGSGSNGIISGNGTTILQADIPYNPAIYRYFINMIINAFGAIPDAPAGGFATPEEMYAWAQANWGVYGQWYLTPDKIIVYLVPGNYHDSSLTVTLLNIVKLFAYVETLEAGEQYILSFDTGKGQVLEADMPFATSGDMLAWAQANWAQYGNWALETTAGDFSDDFSFDFARFSQILALYTASNPDGVIVVSKL